MKDSIFFQNPIPVQQIIFQIFKELYFAYK
jgi:hypothetical protein